MCEAKKTDYVLRLKIDMQHKNAVMRDPVIYRVVTESHYRTGKKYAAWPMYDFESAIEEGLGNITHVLRSNEFDQRIELQNYIASLFGFPPVTYKHYGRYNVVGATTQGREIRALIESGQYIGWDDPRLVTLKALQRRGILPEAFVLLAKKIGLSKTQTNLDFSILAAMNRNLLDEQAKRYFAIKHPVAVTVTGIPKDILTFDLAYHPHAKKGERKLTVSEDYYIETADHNKVAPGQLVRFMDAMNVRKVTDTSYEFVSLEYEKFQEEKNTAGLIHFIPKNQKEMKASMLLADATEIPLLLEENGMYLKPGAIIQFERYCFARLDHIKEDGTLMFWYTHD
jgi:glutamyl-tRNA synthetase